MSLSMNLFADEIGLATLTSLFIPQRKLRKDNQRLLCHYKRNY